MTGSLTLELLARGVSLGCLALLMLRTLYVYRELAAGRYFALLGAGLAAYVTLPPLPDTLLIELPAVAIASAVAPLFWLFCEALFLDQSIPRNSLRLRHAIVMGFLALSLASYAQVA